MQQDSTTSPMMIASSTQTRTSMADLFTPPPYSSIFFQSAASPSSYHTTSSLSSDGRSTTSTTSPSSISAAAAKSLTRLMTDHKDLLARHAFCLSQLRKIFKEAETLRQENTNLRLANMELSNQVNLLIQATVQSSFQTQPFSESRDQYGSSSISSVGAGFGKERDNGSWNEGYSNLRSPKSEKDKEESQEDESARDTLPKSISVRSNGFLKSAGIIGCNSAPVRSTRIRAPCPVSGPKKVYVRGGSQKDGPIELEVYNQGMFKTELCNKWQETQTCPYGDHCQFAHGIDELRPVIRHPRYKTEVCRMVLAGDPCPYGHRCHFRHALTDEEKLMLPLRFD